MLITVKKETEETIEIKTPCWYFTQSPDRWHFINENGDVTTVGKDVIMLWSAGDPFSDSFRISQIKYILQVGHGCTESQFKEALDKELYRIQETVTA